MRKKPLVTLAVLLSLTLILSSCGGSNPSSATGTQPPATDAENEPKEDVAESGNAPADTESSAPEDVSNSAPTELTFEYATEAGKFIAVGFYNAFGLHADGTVQVTKCTSDNTLIVSAGDRQFGVQNVSVWNDIKVP